MIVPMTAERKRLRELLPGIQLGHWPTGPKNGITDVPGVLVNTQSIHGDNGNVNTGVTTILPNKDWFHKGYYAGMFRYNGCGELTGSHWINETGTLVSPIIITSSFSVGACHTGIYKYAAQHHPDDDGSAEWFLMPVVGETYDGYLNDQSQFCVSPEHVIEGIKNASDAPVQEGNTGGGTAMICQGYKGGTGTSSRVIPAVASDGSETSYTVAALVQANYGRRKQLHIAGVPIGRILAAQDAQDEAKAKAAQAINDAKDKTDGSIIIVLATDAPLHPAELQRLATRAAGGLSRVGGYGHNTSGDIFMAFSTANEMPAKGVGYTADGVDVFKAKAHRMESVQDSTINALLEAAADAAEEAIYNALCKAETMVGFKGRKVDALPLDRVKRIMEQYQGLERSLLAE